MDNKLERLGLQFNPFEPAASGTPTGLGDLWVPERWRSRVKAFLEKIEGGQGVKALVLQGEYGSGKTYLLRWLASREFAEERRIRPFFFDNPGVQFYDLADSLFKQIGRYEFAKTLWEYLSPKLPGFQQTLPGDDNLLSWLRSVKKFKQQAEAARLMAGEIQNKGITSDEEIAFRLARIVVETLDQPYFQYQDFVAGRQHSVVAEKEEAPYFKAVIRILKQTEQAEAVAFFLDEFEEISLQKRLTRKQAYDYLATLRRLINVAQDEDFWLMLAMTPQALEISRQLEPALWERFTTQGLYEFIIPPLDEQEAQGLVQARLAAARPENSSFAPSFPFPEDFAEVLRPTTISSPRRLVKVAFYAIAEANQNQATDVPLTHDFLRRVENQVYPAPTEQKANV